MTGVKITVSVTLLTHSVNVLSMKLPFKPSLSTDRKIILLLLVERRLLKKKKLVPLMMMSQLKIVAESLYQRLPCN